MPSACILSSNLFAVKQNCCVLSFRWGKWGPKEITKGQYLTALWVIKAAFPVSGISSVAPEILLGNSYASTSWDTTSQHCPWLTRETLGTLFSVTTPGLGNCSFFLKGIVGNLWCWISSVFSCIFLSKGGDLEHVPHLNLRCLSWVNVT